jgi:hypothetical protein
VLECYLDVLRYVKIQHYRHACAARDAAYSSGVVLGSTALRAHSFTFKLQLQRRHRCVVHVNGEHRNTAKCSWSGSLGSARQVSSRLFCCMMPVCPKARRAWPADICCADLIHSSLLCYTTRTDCQQCTCAGTQQLGELCSACTLLTTPMEGLLVSTTLPPTEDSSQQKQRQAQQQQVDVLCWPAIPVYSF